MVLPAGQGQRLDLADVRNVAVNSRAGQADEHSQGAGAPIRVCRETDGENSYSMVGHYLCQTQQTESEASSDIRKETVCLYLKSWIHTASLLFCLFSAWAFLNDLYDFLTSCLSIFPTNTFTEKWIEALRLVKNKPVQNAHYSYILKAKFKKIFILKIQVNVFKLSSVECFHTWFSFFQLDNLCFISLRFKRSKQLLMHHCLIA